MCRRKSGTHCGCNIAENDRFAGERILYPKLRSAVVPDPLLPPWSSSLPRVHPIAGTRSFTTIVARRRTAVEKRAVRPSGTLMPLMAGPASRRIRKGHALSRGARPDASRRIACIACLPSAPFPLVNSCTCRPLYGPSPRIFALKYTHTCA